MKYVVMLPDAAGPADPRHVTIKNMNHLYDMFAPQVECETEEEVVRVVRAAYPNAIAFPMPVRVGSGTLMMLGVLSDSAKFPRGQDPRSAMFPFVMVVSAWADSACDRKLLNRNRQFNTELWRAPVIVPDEDVCTHAAELRSSDLGYPAQVNVDVGRANGHIVLHLSFLGVEMSLVFNAASLDLVDRG